MARTKAVLGNGARQTDCLSTSLLARVYASVVGAAQILEWLSDEIRLTPAMIEPARSINLRISIRTFYLHVR